MINIDYYNISYCIGNEILTASVKAVNIPGKSQVQDVIFLPSVNRRAPSFFKGGRYKQSTFHYSYKYNSPSFLFSKVPMFFNGCSREFKVVQDNFRVFQVSRNIPRVVQRYFMGVPRLY